MRTYDEALVRALRSSGVEAESFGVPLTIKPIPDDPRPGHLDSRELPYALAFQRRSAGAPAPDIETARRGNGCMNYNLNTVQILETLIERRLVEIKAA